VSGRTRRGNLESWLADSPNAAGRWEAFVTMGTRPDGTADRRHVERKSKADRNRRVRELERQRDAGQASRPGRAKTVQEMLERHLDVVLPQRGRAPWTIASYRSLCEHQVFPRWGGQRIDRMLPEYIEDGYADMLATGLSAGTVRKVHAVCSSAYEIEVKRGNTGRNPFRLVEAPRLAEPDRPALTVDQARAVLAAAAQWRNAARWAVGLACGLRQGEALGLRWQYTDLNAGELRVWYQLQRLPNGGGLVFREIKERRRKTVKLPPELARLLLWHRETQDAERQLAANVWEEHDLVFAQPNGRPIGQKEDWKEWAAILKAAGIPHAGTHAMRHSAATIALGQGVALPIVQEMLGHSDIRVTRGYTHVSGALAEDAAARMGRALFGETATKIATKALGS
jgi:integrase